MEILQFINNSFCSFKRDLAGQTDGKNMPSSLSSGRF